MGLTNIFKSTKKADEEQILRHLAIPSRPKISEPEAQDLVETTREPEPPKPSMPKLQGIQLVSKIEDEQSSFEVPDFSESDLELDFDINSFLPKQETNQTGPEIKQDDKQEQINIEDKKEEPDPEEFIPKFEVEPELDMEREIRPAYKLDHPFGSLDKIKETARKEISKFKQELSTDSFGKKELYIEKNDYLDVLSREEEVISEIKYLKQDMNKILKYSEEEQTKHEQLLQMAREIKDVILNLDTKIFGEG